MSGRDLVGYSPTGCEVRLPAFARNFRDSALLRDHDMDASVCPLLLTLHIVIRTICVFDCRPAAIILFEAPADAEYGSVSETAALQPAVSVSR